MKKLFLFLFLSCLVCAPDAFAQGKTNIVVLGKNKGAVASMQAGGHMLVDAQSTAKKLGGTVEVFSAAKQLKVAFPGMYAILSAPLREVIINAVTVPLPADVVVSGGKIFAPVEFFLLPQIQQALDREITFENNTLTVEQHYTVAFERVGQESKQDQVVLWRKTDVPFSSKQLNAHTVRIEFPNTVLKRTISERPKDDFIRSFTLSQRGKDTVLDVVLGARGKAWKVIETPNTLVLGVAGSEGLLVDTTEAVEDIPLAASSTESDKQTEELVPSVTQDTSTEDETKEDDAEELDLQTGAAVVSGPVMSAAPQPVISAAPLPTIKAKGQLRIMIDPGHGGKDPGAVRKGSNREKDLNLAVAKHLYNYLKKQGFEVKLTRDNDTFVTLAGRSKMANDFKADLFISVHTNAAKRTQANGFEVYFRSEKPTDKDAAEIAAFENEALQYEETHYSFVDKLLQSLAKNEYMNESSKLAGHVRNYVYKEPGIGIAVDKNNSVKQANFYVLRGVQAPAILVEMGYISSPKDRARLNNKSTQKHTGEGIGKGVVAYLKQEGKIK